MWQNVFWLDDTKLVISYAKHYVRLQTNTAHDPEHNTPTMQCGGGSSMYWKAAEMMRKLVALNTGQSSSRNTINNTAN